MQHKVASQADALEIAMKLEASPIAEISVGMAQIHNQLANLTLQLQDIKKCKEVREEVWCTQCKTEGHSREHCPIFAEYLASSTPNPLPQARGPWCEICRTNGHRPQYCPLLQKYVQTPKNMFFTFCKSVGHDDNNCRAYELMIERTQDVNAMQSDQQNNIGTAWYDQGRARCGGFRGCGRGGGFGIGRRQINYYSCRQQGNYKRDCTNPTIICKYCQSYDHVIEECPILQNKWQEKRPWMGNHNVQLIGVENRTRHKNLNVIMRSGWATDGAQKAGEKQPTTEWVQKSTMKPPIFDLQKEKKTFLQAQRDFCDLGASCSKTDDKRKGTARILLRSDPYAGEVQHQMSTRPYEESESTGLVRSFLQNCLKLLRDERELLEIQTLIHRCEQSTPIIATNIVVHQIKKYIRTRKEMRLNAQIGDYEMDEVILDLGSEVNVLTKKTWELLGKPKLRYSPIQLRLANQQRVCPMGRLSNV